MKLDLDSVGLVGCHDYVSMNQLWIKEKAINVTRINLISALITIRQNNTTKIYKKISAKSLCLLKYLNKVAIVACGNYTTPFT